MPRTFNHLGKKNEQAFRHTFLKKYVTSDCPNHRLRKVYSSYLADLAVVPGALQAQLGHADAALTLNVYAQVLPESQRKAVEALEGLLFRNVPKPASEGRIQ